MERTYGFVLSCAGLLKRLFFGGNHHSRKPGFLFVFPFPQKYALKCRGQKAPRGWANFSAPTNGRALVCGLLGVANACRASRSQKRRLTLRKTQSSRRVAGTGNISLVHLCGLTACVFVQHCGLSSDPYVESCICMKGIFCCCGIRCANTDWAAFSPCFQVQMSFQSQKVPPRVFLEKARPWMHLSMLHRNKERCLI